MATLSSRLAPLTVSVPAASEWVAYTPAWSSSGTQPVLGNGSIFAWWRRLGDSVEIRLNVTMGSTTTYGTGNWKFSFPSGLALDTAKLFNATNIGGGLFYDASALTSKAALVRYAGATDGFNLFSSEGTQGTVTNTSPFTWATSDEISISGVFPITGWTSHTASSTSANAVVVGGQSVGSTLILGATSNQGFEIRANNTAALSGSAAGAITAPLIHNVTTGNINSGRYTPTLTGVTNIVSAGTAASCHYTRTGNIVTVAISISNITTTSSGASTQLDASLPIASNLTGFSDALGGGGVVRLTATISSAPVVVEANAASDRFSFYWVSPVTTAVSLYITAQYEVK